MEVFFFMSGTLKYCAKYLQMRGRDWLSKGDFYFTLLSYLAQESIVPAAL